MADEDWLSANRAVWDELTVRHLDQSELYDLGALRAGQGQLNAIEEAELGPVEGVRVLHLQCHFGYDSLVLAQRGAHVTGVDFSAEAVAAARRLARELGLEDRAVFVESTVADAARRIGPPGSFDLVYVTWGAIMWLPELASWAGCIAHALRPGGRLYLAEVHPVALVLDDAAPEDAAGRPGFLVPYLERAPHVDQETRDYDGGKGPLAASRSYSWLHPVSDIVTALLEAGVEISALREHDGLTWDAFRCLVQGEDDLWRWPDRPWLPLALTIEGRRQDRPRPRGCPRG